jgi:hypothetical protein
MANIESRTRRRRIFEHFKFEVPKGQVRIDKYLMGLIQNAT